MAYVKVTLRVTIGEVTNNSRMNSTQSPGVISETAVLGGRTALRNTSRVKVGHGYEKRTVVDTWETQAGGVWEGGCNRELEVESFVHGMGDPR